LHAAIITKPKVKATLKALRQQSRLEKMKVWVNEDA
jgi:hypothetical protein